MKKTICALISCLMMLLVLIPCAYSELQLNLIKSYSSSFSHSMCVDSNGNVLVNAGGGNIIKLSSDLQYISSFSGYYPYGIVVSNTGNIYIADSQWHGWNPPQGNHRLVKLNSDYSYNSSFGSTAGTGTSHLYNPSKVAVDASGNIYVADTTNNRIVKLNSSLQYQAQYVLNSCAAVAVRGGYLYAGGGGLIVKLNLSLTETGVSTTTSGGVRDLAVDNAGDVYVAGNDIIKLNGNDLTQIRVFGGNAWFQSVMDIDIDSQGYIYISNLYKGVAKFQETTISGNPPVAMPGSSQTVREGIKVSLDGSASYDAEDGVVKTYAWSQISGPAVTLSSTSVSKPTFTSPNITGDAEVILSLVVTDFGGNASSSAYITIKLIDIDSPPASHNVLSVNAGESIQAAINSAKRGDTIIVKPGTYYERIKWPLAVGDIELISEKGPETTIIDGGNSGSVIFIGNGQWNIKIEGFTIKNGGSGSPVTFHQGPFGGGICIDEDVIANIKNCWIKNNGVSGEGGAIFVSYRSAIDIEGCLIENNTGRSEPGIYYRSSFSGGSIRNCIIRNNSGSSSGYTNSGIFCQSSPIVIENNIIHSNGSGINVYTPMPNIRNNIIMGNNGIGITVVQNPGTDVSKIAYNDIYNSSVSIAEQTFDMGSNGNINQDPLFESYLTDYHLKTASPCMNAGDPDPLFNDLDGSRNDMGVYGGQTPYGYIAPEPCPILCPGNGTVVINFGAQYGIWVYNAANGGNWSQLHIINPSSITAGNIDFDSKKDLIIDFGFQYGIWAYCNNSTWVQLHNISSEQIIAADLDNNGQDDIVVDFGSQYGIWIYSNNSTWQNLHTISPVSITAGNFDSDPKKDLIIDFGTQNGIWIYSNNSTWSKLHNATSESITVGDINGDGIDEITVDFGSQYGIWIYEPNSATWSQLHTISPESITVGNIDADPKKDLIIDFGLQCGIWAYCNNFAWQQIHNVSPDSMTSGDLNSNGIDDLIIDFGPAYGVWVRNDDDTWWQLHTVSP